MVDEGTETLQYVPVGKVAIGLTDEQLVSTPLGSCVAVVAYDVKTKIGGMAHAMLPGTSPHQEKENRFKYTDDAIDELLKKLQQAGVPKNDLEIFLIGGANVLKKENDTIAKEIVVNVVEVVNKHRLKMVASSLGGFERRTVTLNIKKETVYYTIGDSKEKVLWKYTNQDDERNK